VDLDRLEAALGGQASVDVAYSLGALEIASGYFPLRGPSGAVEAVLGLEAGEPFSAARRGMARSLAVSLAISLAGALALAGVAASWSRAERGRASLEIEAARGEAAARAAAAAAHEIRHPLAVIRGVVELMKERGRERLGERDQRALDDVLGEVERLRRMAQDFLELSAERVSVEGAVDLEAVLREAARGVEASFPAIRIRCPPGPYPALRGDAGRLRQVLANLLGNAAVAQGVGDVAVAVEVDADGAAVRLRVRDRGPGVAPEVRARLFEPFFTTRANGTGLGLAVSRRIAEAHGGSLQLVEAPGPGATFELRLPIASG
jgi:signal transduction histidine kinase